MSHFTTFPNTAFFFLIYKLKVGGSPALSKSTSTIFPTAFAHFVSVSPLPFSSFIIITITCYDNL